MSHIPPNYAFLLFWSIYGLVYWKLLFLVKKNTISERSSEILGNFFFLNKLEKGQIWRKIWISCKQPFLYMQLNGTNINKNCFSPQSEPHTAKLCFPVVLKHFRDNSLKISLFSQKCGYLRKEHRNTQKFCFS